jgi:hypothetical protein
MTSYSSARLTAPQWAMVALVSSGIFVCLHAFSHWPDQWPIPFGVSQVYGDQIEMVMKAKSPALRNADIVLLGSSSILHAFIEDEDLSNLLSSGRRKTLRVLNLSASGLSFEQMLFVLDILKIRENQTFIVFVTPRSFARDFTDTSAGLFTMRSLFPEIDFAERDSIRPGVQTTLKRRAVAAIQRLAMSNARRTAPGYARLHAFSLIHLYGLKPCLTEIYSDRPVSSKARSVFNRKYVRMMKRYYPPDADRETRLLEQIIRKIHENHADVILSEYPHIANETIDLEWKDDYQKRIGSVCSRHHVTYLDINGQINLSTRDFQDPLHVNLQGRRTWSRFFISRLDRNIIHEH